MSGKLINPSNINSLSDFNEGYRHSLAVESNQFQRYHRLHELTKKHWKEQAEKNAAHLDEILSSADASLVLRPIAKKLPRGTIEDVFSNRTIELCVITDPPLFDKVKVGLS